VRALVDRVRRKAPHHQPIVADEGGLRDSLRKAGDLARAVDRLAAGAEAYEVELHFGAEKSGERHAHAEARRQLSWSLRCTDVARRHAEWREHRFSGIFRRDSRQRRQRRGKDEHSSHVRGASANARKQPTMEHRQGPPRWPECTERELAVQHGSKWGSGPGETGVPRRVCRRRVLHPEGIRRNPTWVSRDSRGSEDN
jgi:hypothetical protein